MYQGSIGHAWLGAKGWKVLCLSKKLSLSIMFGHRKGIRFVYLGLGVKKKKRKRKTGGNKVCDKKRSGHSKEMGRLHCLRQGVKKKRPILLKRGG